MNQAPNNLNQNNQGFNSAYNPNVGQNINVNQSVFNPQPPVKPISK